MGYGEELYCFHCEHKWNSRKNIRPLQCPKCTCRIWDREHKHTIYNRKEKNPVEKFEEEKIMQEEKIKPKKKFELI